MRKIKPGKTGILLPSVKLISGGYSVPVGSYGLIESESDVGQFYWVKWLQGGSSGPIAAVDLEQIGQVFIEDRLQQSSIVEYAEHVRKASEEYVPECNCHVAPEACNWHQEYCPLHTAAGQ